MKDWNIKEDKAQNAIYLKEDNGGKGRFFRARFLQPGLVKYSFGVCLLTKETIDKFVYKFVGCPVVIDHKDVTDESAKDMRVGVISKVDFDPFDAWYWCEGVIFDQEAIDLVNNGYNVSCQYEITQYATNDKEELHNGNPYDKEILDGAPEHLAIVKNPRYENAMIAVNAIDVSNEKDNLEAQNGWVTLDRTDEDGNPVRVFIEGAYGQSTEERNRKVKVLESFKEGQETKYDFTHTRANVSEVQQKQIKKIIDNVYTNYTGKPIAQVEVRTMGGGALGLCTSSKEASIVGLDSSLFSGKYTQERWDESVKKGYHPKTDNSDMITNVLTHELGHAISVNTDSKEFWKEIDKVHGEYLSNITKEDIKNPDFISNYARVNEYEFVAEAFAQAQLSKKYGKYTKQVIDLMDKHLAKSTQLKIVADNSDKNDNVIIWEEEFGGGYPIDEEAYKDFKKEQEKSEDEEMKENKASNSFIDQFRDTLYTVLAEGITNRLGE